MAEEQPAASGEENKAALRPEKIYLKDVSFETPNSPTIFTLEWQPLTTRHGYVRPGIVDDAGLTVDFDDALAIAADLHEAMVEGAPTEAAYAVPMAFRVRYVMQFNAREAMHMIELRSAPHGHPAYRDVVQQMADRIEHEAGHRLVAGMLRYLDRSEAELGRLESERRLEGRRSSP